MSAAPKHSRRRSALDERIETRVSAEDKRLLKRAASLENRSVTEFVRSSVRNAALETIQRHEAIAISGEEAIAFVDALMNPPAPGPGLRDAARAYRDLIGS